MNAAGGSPDGMSRDDECAWDPRYQFELPAELIARHPAPERDASRLMVVDPARVLVRDAGTFRGLLGELEAGDLLVLNETRVFPARLRGRRATGGAVEIVLLEPSGSEVAALVRPLTRLREGEVIQVGESALVLGARRPDGTVLVRFDGEDASTVADRWGEPPIPPYLKRRAEPEDRERYQAVFARERGSAAAPTASLHFTPELLSALEAKGVRRALLTLHLGYGTFAPVDPGQDRLHAEPYSIPRALPEQMEAARGRGGRVVAVGTTVVRALESWARTGRLVGETDIFLKPGHEFRAVDALVTNFHLPSSSLLMLVHAFAGDLIFDAYRHAIRERFRFFSYGDAMFIASRPPSGTG